MATRLSVNEAATRLSEYLERVAEHGERFVVERDGKPVGALVPVGDLDWAEDAKPLTPEAAAEEQVMHRLEAAEVIRRPKGAPKSPSDRLPPIEIQGRRGSEDIIADGEHHARLLAGEEELLQRLEAAGLIQDAKWQRAALVSFEPLEIEGRPLSEDIIADREHHARLLSGQ